MASPLRRRDSGLLSVPPTMGAWVGRVAQPVSNVHTVSASKNGWTNAFTRNGTSVLALPLDLVGCGFRGPGFDGGRDGLRLRRGSVWLQVAVIVIVVIIVRFVLSEEHVVDHDAEQVAAG